MFETKNFKLNKCQDEKILVTSNKRIFIPGLSTQCLQRSKEEQLTDTRTNVFESEKKALS